jgi:hypothetical protein
VAEAGTGGGGRQMEALVRVERGGRAPFEVLWRRYGLLAPPPNAAGEAAADE